MTATIPIVGPASVAGDVSFGGFKATLLGTPSAATDAATKGYVDGLKGAMLTASSVGTRPASPTTGQEIYRTDKGFVEQWDGAAWRVLSGSVVGALTDITDPYTGQLAVLSTDKLMYRYIGGVWVTDESNPRGRKVTQSRTVGVGPSTFTSETILDSVIFTSDGPSRRYQFSMEYQNVQSDTSYFTMRGRWRVGAPLLTTSTQIWYRDTSAGSPGNWEAPLLIQFSATGITAGQISIGITVVRTGGTGNADYRASATGPAWIWVDDVGNV